jgi:hypothetical protein
VRDQIGPVADFKRAVIVERLPKTRSGKVLRGTMQRIADRQEYKVPPTIDDASVLQDLTRTLEDPQLLEAWGPRRQEPWGQADRSEQPAELAGCRHA